MGRHRRSNSRRAQPRRPSRRHLVRSNRHRRRPPRQPTAARPQPPIHLSDQRPLAVMGQGTQGPDGARPGPSLKGTVHQAKPLVRRHKSDAALDNSPSCHRRVIFSASCHLGDALATQSRYCAPTPHHAAGTDLAPPLQPAARRHPAARRPRPAARRPPAHLPHRLPRTPNPVATNPQNRRRLRLPDHRPHLTEPDPVWIPQTL